MAVEKYGQFITLSEGGDVVRLPYPYKDSGLQTIATMVDTARTQDGVVRGEVIGNVSKVELTWKVLTPTVWASLLTFFNNHFYFNCTYLDMATNSWKTRKFYVGDRSAQPFLINPDTGVPKYYMNCKANIVGVGGD